MIRLTSIIAIAFVSAAVPAYSGARADDLSDCLQWTSRYQAGLPELEQARKDCEALEQQIRNDPKYKRNPDALEIALQSMTCPRKKRACSRIAPERTVISCDKFLRTRPSDRTVVMRATQIREAAKNLYDECTAQ